MVDYSMNWELYKKHRELNRKSKEAGKALWDEAWKLGWDVACNQALLDKSWKPDKEKRDLAWEKYLKAKLNQGEKL